MRRSTLRRIAVVIPAISVLGTAVLYIATRPAITTAGPAPSTAVAAPTIAATEELSSSVSGTFDISDRSTAPPPPLDASAIQALATLNTLPTLASRPNAVGYQRGCKVGQACSFGPAWSDDTEAPDGHNGCGTRDDVLREQLTAVQFRDGSDCVVIAGVLDDPYTGRLINFTKADAGAVEVDHLVPLALAWDLGAATWPQAQRSIFANDTQRQLIATSAAANRAKSDDGPGSWLPPDSNYQCTYGAKFVTALAAYRLPVVQADKEALIRVLTDCR
jgi:hypothetical protein